MRFHYLFNDRVNDEKHYHKLIIVKQKSKFKYILELYKRPIDQFKTIDSLKSGCFLYMKNNKYCIYYARNYVFRDFNYPARFIVEDKDHNDLGNALFYLFNMKY